MKAKPPDFQVPERSANSFLFLKGLLEVLLGILLTLSMFGKHYIQLHYIYSICINLVYKRN